jgi:hypothetical protein
MTRRRRTDLALMLIIRRAEREATLHGHSHSEEPDTPTTIHPERHPDDPEAQHPH